MFRRGNFLFWTIVALLALVFFYTFSSKKLYEVTVLGDENFLKNVKNALGSLHINFKIVDDSNIVFDQKSKTFTINGKVYHLTWSGSVIKRVVKNTDCKNCRFVPVINGEYDENYFEILKDCGDIIRGKIPRYFQDGWLIVKIAVFDGDKLLFIYDPLSGSWEYQRGGEE